MATLEERIQALEQENTARKKTEELLTIAVRALVSKEAFEKLQDTVEKSQEQNGKLFDALRSHDRLTNTQLAEMRNQQSELDGKVVGLRTEMRQRFTEQDNKITGLQTTQTEHTTLLQQILARLPEKP
ncbi:MAG TPA: hypothetical protein VGM01_14240 [Ktedonobacteraceae bacterium]